MHAMGITVPSAINGNFALLIGVGSICRAVVMWSAGSSCCRNHKIAAKAAPRVWLV
jgi:hypothetical protein